MEAVTAPRTNGSNLSTEEIRIRQEHAVLKVRHSGFADKLGACSR